VMAAVVFGAKTKVNGWMIVALFLLPAADCAVSLVNQLVTTLFSPKALPKLDFSKGVPVDFTTMVVVPTLLTSEPQMSRAVRDLEIRFLANRDANIHFALLTDPPDAGQQFDEKDKLAGQCAQLIDAMNAKYAGEGKGSFFLFHRHRAYNPSEGIWMAWERKRGKLLDFNKLLLGTSDNFPVKAGNLELVRTVKYVVTLDSDTQLPRDAAHRLTRLRIPSSTDTAYCSPASTSVFNRRSARGSLQSSPGTQGLTFTLALRPTCTRICSAKAASREKESTRSTRSSKCWSIDSLAIRFLATT
jgi:hypothetical protein